MIAMLVLAATLGQPKDADKPALPVDWLGRWSGTLKIEPVGGKAQETPVELVIEPLKDSKNYTWRITYGDGKMTPIRNYELHPQEKPGHFVIDEKNGLLIDAWLVGHVLHCQFHVGEVLLPVRYERKGDTMVFSLAAYTTKNPRSTKLTAGDVEAKSYVLQSTQLAEMKKVKGD